MRRAFWLLLVLCLAAAVAVAQYGSSAQDKSAPGAKPDFDMTASYIEACSCDMFCPCYYNTHSTLHDGKQFCKANLVLKVDKGYYKETKLDGAKIWIAADLGSDRNTGKDSWLVVNFDPSVSKAQQAALADILGQLYPIPWQKKAVDTAAFTWNVDTKTGVAEAKMSNGKGEVILEQERGFEACLPTARDNLLTYRNLDTGSLVTTFPFTSSTLSMERGVLYGIAVALPYTRQEF